MASHKKQGKYMKELPSYMQPTESSAKKTRGKTYNSCKPRRMSVGIGVESFGDARLDRAASETPPGHRKFNVSKLCSDSLPRYMQPTESSAKKMNSDKYNLRPPRIPPGSMRNNMATPKGEPNRVQMSNMAMNSFVESLRCSAYPDRTQYTTAQKKGSRSSSRNRKSKLGAGANADIGDGWLKEDSDLPRYQQQTVLSSLRTNGRTRS